MSKNGSPNAYAWFQSPLLVMLETICNITRSHPSTIVFGVIALIVQTAFSIWFSLVVIGAYQTWFSTTSNNASLNLAMVFLVFSFYWTSQVNLSLDWLCNVTHSQAKKGDFVCYPCHFGRSICHGLLFERHCPTSNSWKFETCTHHKLWIHLLWQSLDCPCQLYSLLPQPRSYEQRQWHLELLPLYYPMHCWLLPRVICMFHLFVDDTYSYTPMLLGMVHLLRIQWCCHFRTSFYSISSTYMELSQGPWYWCYDQWFIDRQRLVYGQVFHDCITMNVPWLIHCEQWIGGLLVGVLCSLLGFIYLEVSRPAYNQTGGMTPVVVLVCFLIGASMFSSIATVISSGVATTFVCLAEDPDALRR